MWRLRHHACREEYIDAREDTSLIARYINDCRNPAAGTFDARTTCAPHCFDLLLLPT